MAVNGGAGCPCFRQLGQLGVLERAHPHAWLAAIRLAPALPLSLPRAPSPPPLFCCCHQVCRSSCGHGRAVAAASVWSELGAALLRLVLGHVP